MTAPTDQFVDIAKRSQEAVSTAVRSWADSVQNLTGQLGAGQSQLPNPHDFVNTYFDFAEKVLANQRQLATQFVSASVKAGESVQEQVTKLTDQAAAQTVNGADVVGEKVTEGSEAAAEATARTARAARTVVKS